ncbi:MAG: AsmA family protein [Desulfuromonadaceae bacterium]|nr:AsmA family protein [Desulfuromonadaceae bacterium]
MGKMKKIGVIIGVILIVGVITGAVLVKVLITPERVKSTVIPLAEQQLGRSVTLDSIDISLFSGIVLEGFSIKERDSQEDFIRAERALLRYRFWPLLRLQIEVDEITLQQPQITVVRHSDGTFNFSDLLTAADRAPEPAPTVEPSAAQTGAAAAAINLSIANLTLKDGQLLFIDNAVDAPRSHTYEINQLQINARDLSLRAPFPIKLSCNINGAPLALSGQVDLMQSSMDADLSVNKLDIAAFSPYFASSIPGKLRSLALSTELQINAAPTNIASSGNLTLENISITLDALPDAPIADARFKLDYAAEFKPDAAHLHLSKADMDYNGIKAQLSGTIRELDKDPIMELELVTQNLSMATALAALPPALSASAAESKPGGALSLHAYLKGPLSEGAAILRRAELKLHDLQADAAGMRPRLNGQFILEKERLHSEDLTLKVGDNVAQMDITARNLFGTPIVMTHNMRAERFDLDAILASAATPAATSGKLSQPQQQKSPGATIPEELGPFAIPLTLDGSIAINQALYQGLSITDFSMLYRLQDNVLDISTLSGAISGGTFSQSARVDLRQKGLSYSGKTSLKELQLDPLVTALVPESAHTLFGALTLDLNFNGRGTLPETLKQNLNATGNLKVTEARLSGTELTQKLAEFLNLSQLNDIRFDTCAAALDMRNGLAQVDGNFSGSNLRVEPKGTIGLDESLNLSLNARLSPNLAQELDKKGHIAGFLTDAEGWALLPLKVKGTFSAPRISLDEAALQQQVGKKAIDTLQQRLLDKLAPKQEKTPESSPGSTQESTQETGTEPQPTEQDAARKLIDDAFKGIFGK